MIYREKKLKCNFVFFRFFFVEDQVQWIVFCHAKSAQISKIFVSALSNWFLKKGNNSLCHKLKCDKFQYQCKKTSRISQMVFKCFLQYSGDFEDGIKMLMRMMNGFLAQKSFGSFSKEFFFFITLFHYKLYILLMLL